MDKPAQAVQVLQVKDLRVEIHPVHSTQPAAVEQLKQVAQELGIPAALVEMVHQLIRHGD
jgi:signal recognition particle GTPase